MKCGIECIKKYVKNVPAGDNPAGILFLFVIIKI